MLPFEILQDIARWAALAAPPGCRDDARQSAWVGILQAQRTYNPFRDATLWTYARLRAQGAVRDYLRTIDPLTRVMRRNVRSGHSPAPRHVPADRVPAAQSHEASVLRALAIGRISLEELAQHARLNGRQRHAVACTLSGQGADARTLAAARKQICRALRFHETSLPGIPIPIPVSVEPLRATAAPTSLAPL